MELTKINLYLIIIVFIGISTFPMDCYGAKVVNKNETNSPAHPPHFEDTNKTDHAALVALADGDDKEAQNPIKAPELPEADLADLIDPLVINHEVDSVNLIPEVDLVKPLELLVEVVEKVPELIVPVEPIEQAEQVPEAVVTDQVAESVEVEADKEPAAVQSSLMDIMLNATSNTEPVPPPQNPRSCHAVTLDTIEANMRTMLENPAQLISGQDYACTILSLLQHTKDNKASVFHLENNLNSVKEDLDSLYLDVSQHSHRFNTVEKLLNETTAEEFEEISILREKLYHFILRGTKEVQVNITTLVEKNAQAIQDLKSTLNETLEMATGQAIIFESALGDLQSREHSWLKNTDELQKTVTDLAARASKLEIEIVSRITEIVAEIAEVENKFKTEMEQENARATREEGHLKTRLAEQSQKTQDSLEKIESQLTSEKIAGQDYSKEISHQLHQNLSNIHQGLNKQIIDGFEQSKENHQELQKLIEIQNGRIDLVESEWNTKLDNEISRASKAEMAVSETLLHHTSLTRKTEGSFKTSLDSEITRAVTAEKDLQNLLSDQKDKLRNLEKDLRIQIEVETLRAKGTEIQLSNIITSEADRAKSSEIEIHDQLNTNVSRLISDLMNEYNRAKSTEDKLERKIGDEILRAVNTESNLLANINDELKRASEKEQELHISLTNDGMWLRKLAQDLENKMQTVDTRTNAVEEKFVTKLDAQTRKIEEVQYHLQSALAEEVSRSQSSKSLLEAAIELEVHRAKEFEIHVLSTVMAEVVRAGDFEKTLIANLTDETNRAKLIEQELKQDLIGNFTEIGDKLEGILKLVEAQTIHVEAAVVESTKNFTNHLLTLADEMDKKLESNNQTLESRLKNMDEDFKKCCSSSWSNWRNPNLGSSASSGGGVFNRVFGFLGRHKNQTKAAKSGSTESAIPSTSAKESRRVDVDLDFSGELLKSSDKKFLGDDLDKQVISEKDLSQHLQRDASDGRAMPVFVHRSNSKVRNIYG